MRSILLILIATITCFAQDYSKLQEYSNAIDNLLENQYKHLNISGNPIINEDIFVRRAYLTIIGRIPTLEEYDSYISNKLPTKRQELIKHLFKHPGHTSHMFNFWADSLRLRDRLAPINNFHGGPYIQYIKEQITKNVPYNKFVFDLLTSSGSYYTNPATGYFYRDFGMPLDNLIGTMKVFTGVDVSCAQCHDDPFQDFTQLEFYEMAAFFAQNELRNRSDKQMQEKITNLRKQIDEMIKEDPEKNRGLNNRINNFVRATQATVEVVNNKTIKLPHDYQYSDRSPNDVVEPKYLKSKGKITNRDDLRIDGAKWITSPDHPTFSKNIVNRYWGWVFGRYIMTSFDSIDSSPHIDSPLVNLLSKIMIECKYDTQKFLFVLTNTKLFQRETYTGPNTNSSKFTFIGPVQQRLTAEQLWDSILSIVLEKPEEFKISYHKEYSEIMQIYLEDFNLETLKERYDNYTKVIRDKYTNAPKHGNYVLARASEINDLTSSNNVLNQLGRSDRELIQTSSLEGSVAQVISFMNGQIGDIATSRNLKLMQTLQNKSPQAKIEIAFKAILNRLPTIEEKSQFAGIHDDDIIWALINTNQFKFTK